MYMYMDVFLYGWLLFRACDFARLLMQVNKYQLFKFYRQAHWSGKSMYVQGWIVLF